MKLPLTKMRNTLEFEELKDNWPLFENLVADYFEEIKKDRNIETIEVELSGEGPDGGVDILLAFRFSDIAEFKRKWIVQCKFYKRSVQRKDLATVNIPTLIHEHGADGYLLVCRRDVGSGVRQMFRRLRENCNFLINMKYGLGMTLRVK